MDEPLARHTAVRLGGPADWLYVAQESGEELSAVVGAAWAAGFPLLVLGGGANVLVSDAGVRGLVVINAVTTVSFNAEIVTASAGHGLSKLARKCAAAGLAGLEWAASIPGTVGGSVVNNAGAHGGDIAGCLVSADVLDAAHGRQTLQVDDLAYGYRTSALKAQANRRFLVLAATFRLQPGDPTASAARIDEVVAYRKRTHIVWLLLDLFRIHQNHWDEIRHRQMPSLDEFRADIAALTEAAGILKERAAKAIRVVDLPTAICAAFSAASLLLKDSTSAFGTLAHKPLSGRTPCCLWY